MKLSFWRRPDVKVYALLAAFIVGQFAWVFRHPVLDDTLVVPGNIGGVTWQDQQDGNYYFSIHGQPATYAIRGNQLDMDRVLEASRTSGHAVEFSIHLDGAMLIEDAPQYWVEVLEFRGKKYGPFAAMQRKSWRTMPAAQASLLRAIAFASAAKYAEALRELEAADLDALPDSMRALALKTRGSAAQDLAYLHDRAVNDDDDALLLGALRDFRAAAELRPDDFELRHWQSSVLANLGAYDQALANSTAVLERWPDHRFTILIGRATVHRIRGEYELALAEVDKALPPGEAKGMKFHYHRAWILTRLGRFAEAEAELDQGLKTQPDYPWAFQKRACARAQQGLIAEAIKDQRYVVNDLARRADANRDDVLADVLIEQRQLLGSLEGALRDNPGKPTSAACERDSPNPNYSRREPSRLL